MEIQELPDYKAYRSEIDKYLDEPLLEYVWKVANKFMPVVDQDGCSESHAPIIFTNRWIESKMTTEERYARFLEFFPNNTQEDIEEYYNTFADYAAGGTKIHLFLPFCGWIECNVDEFMGKSMWIKYLVDVLSGSVVAHVAALNKGEWQIVYTKEGNFKSEVPISGANYMSYYAGVMGSISQIFMGAATNNPGAVANGMVNAISAKPQYQRGGNISGTSGLMSVRNPYLIFEVPNMWIPDNFKSLKGYVSNYKCRIGDQTGFIKASIQNEELTSFSCTEKELEMIKQALAEGIYI